MAIIKRIPIITQGIPSITSRLSHAKFKFRLERLNDLSELENKLFSSGYFVVVSVTT